MGSNWHVQRPSASPAAVTPWTGEPWESPDQPISLREVAAKVDELLAGQSRLEAMVRLLLGEEP